MCVVVYVRARIFAVLFAGSYSSYVPEGSESTGYKHKNTFDKAGVAHYLFYSFLTSS